MAAVAYDDDEKNEPVGFEQDPDSDDFGDGYFTYADGTRRYASDPESASQLSAAGKTTAADPGQGTGSLTSQQAGGQAGADEEIQPPADPGTRVSYAGDPASPYANALAANEGATGTAAGAQPAAPPAAVSPAAAPAAQKPGVMDMDAEEAKMKAAAGAPAPGAPPTMPARTAAPVSGEPALPTASNTRSASHSDSASDTSGKTGSLSVSRTGSAMPAQVFQAQQQDLQKTYEDAIHGNQEAQGKLADLTAAHEAQMAQQGRDREAQTQAAIAQNEARKQLVTRKIQEVDSRPTDINKIWKDKGTVGTVLGALGVAMGSLYATKRGGPNTALEAIERQKQDSIKVQLADRDSELRGLERELGSIDAAVPVYEARMNQALSMQAQGMLKGEQSAQVRANIQDFIGKMNTERAQKLADGARAYYGTVATQQAATADTHSTRSGQTGSEASDVYAPPKGAEPKERTEDQAKTASVMQSFSDVARARGLVRDKDGNWVTGGKAADDETNKAAQEAATRALVATGYKPGDAEDTVASGSGTDWAGYELKAGLIPFYGLIKSAPASPEELAKKLNAAERALRERLGNSDRAAPARGAAPAAWR